MMINKPILLAENDVRVSVNTLSRRGRSLSFLFFQFLDSKTTSKPFFQIKMSKTKIAVVTGANKGLGYAIVKLLCQEYDGKVYLTSRDNNRGIKATGDLKNLGLAPVFHQLDVVNQESINTFIETIKNNEEEVDIIINNAGVLYKDCKEDTIFKTEQILSVNFFALVNFTEAILPFVKKGGKIVNISSSSGHLSRIPSEELRRKISAKELTLDELKAIINEYLDMVKKGLDLAEGWGDSPYVVSKVAVNCYTFLLHRRLKDRGILVNCVHPGYVISDMTNGTGSISPEDAAKIPVDLALRSSTGGRYVWHNGEEVPWDGKDPRNYIDKKQ